MHGHLLRSTVEQIANCGNDRMLIQCNSASWHRHRRQALEFDIIGSPISNGFATNEFVLQQGEACFEHLVSDVLLKHWPALNLQGRSSAPWQHLTWVASAHCAYIRLAANMTQGCNHCMTGFSSSSDSDILALFVVQSANHAVQVHEMRGQRQGSHCKARRL